MQGNGFKIFLIGFFLALSGYYLYPSVQNYFINSKIETIIVVTTEAIEAAEKSRAEQQQSWRRVPNAEANK